MLKKLIIGILCFIILAVTAVGIYLYMLDWNSHKTLVAQRLSQITGLKASIDGNLTVKLFPSPEFSAGMVRFSKNSGGHDSLITVNEIIAKVDLLPLLDNNIVVKSLTLTQATAFIEINEKGELNWSGVNSNSSTKSGNVEISFNDIRVNNSTLSYKNKKNNQTFELPNISANISAPSLQGPYRINGKLIHNSSEIQFKGDITKSSELALKMNLNNVSSGTSVTIDGTLGQKATGNITVDTQSVYDAVNTIFGNNHISERYNKPLYLSFKYNYENDITKLNNFTTKYDKNLAGSGSVIIKKVQDRQEINADFDMAKFDLDLPISLGKDLINYCSGGKKLADSVLGKTDFSLSLKSPSAVYNHAEAQNLSLNITLKNNIIDIARFGIVMPGETIFKTVGKISPDNNFNYIFNQMIDSKDFRTFASVFNIDLAKFATEDNKKSIFKKAQAEINTEGNLEMMKISVPRAVVDSTALSGNLGFSLKDKAYAVAEINASKIFFDKYIEAGPSSLANASLKDKFVYQMNFIPWNREIEVDAEVKIAGAVYNKIPMENVSLQFSSHNDSLTIRQLDIKNIAGAALNLNLSAEKIFTNPNFKELNYDIKTDNLPLFTTTLGLPDGGRPLFKRKLFASQGAISGSFDEFGLSSIQKFGDTEFSYTGTVLNQNKAPVTVNGDLELKTNNFSSFIKALGIDYSPDIPITTFTLAAKVSGNPKTFSLDTAKSYLGANAINGSLKFDNTSSKPQLTAQLNLDKFEADRWFNIDNSPQKKEKTGNTFISNPSDSQSIDYTPLKKADFDITASVKQLSGFGKNFSDVKTKLKLTNGILNVSSFEATQEKSNINLHFVLDSNNIPSIDGFFSVKDLKSPELGGSLYVVESGWLTAEGTFNSVASSYRDFLDNLNSKGKFSLNNTSIRGWDLDIIKFELEQRKSLAGFEDTVLNSLKSGKSGFAKIRGAYTVSKGLVVADSVIWESPVVNMNMKFDLNLSDWLFTAVFNAVYHNASFSDIFKFTFDGNLANPSVKTDLSESIARIGEIEDKIKNARHYKEKEKMERIGGKITDLKTSIDKTLQDITRMTLDVVRFKPLTQNKNVVNIYQENINTLKTVENNINQLKKSLSAADDEETLINIEATLGAEKAKLKYIPKILEDNFVVDSKYIFDDTFNKIAWLYNVAHNNSAYHTSLTDVYMAQIEILKSSDTPVAENKTAALQNGINKVKETMDSISSLHAKIRDNYLTIIDAGKISEMNENNNLAQQALKTILKYTQQMNSDIIANIDAFRAVLGITSRDYDDYLVYPPETAEEIDVSLPTSKNEKSEKDSAHQKENAEETRTQESSDISVPEKEEELPVLESSNKESSETNVLADSKKKEALSLAISSLSQGLNNVFNRLAKESSLQRETETIADADFSGLSALLKSNISASEVQQPLPTDTALKEKNQSDTEEEKVLLTQTETGITPSIADNEKQTVITSVEIQQPLLQTPLPSVLSDILPEKKQALLPNTTSSLPDTTFAPMKNIVVAADDKSASGNNDIPTFSVHNNMKINPVVALDIGKETSVAPDNSPALVFAKKQPFGTALQDKTAKTADTENASVTAEAAPTTETVSAGNQPDDKTKDSRQTQKVLLTLFTDAQKDFTPQKSHISDEATTIVETAQNTDTGNLYIFALSAQKLPLTGLSGKSMLQDRPAFTKTVPSAPHRYLYAADNPRKNTFSGIIAKKLSLFGM